MSKTDKHLQDLAQIRSMMEQSSRFLSLSGLSGIFAGIYAVIAAIVAYTYLGLSPFESLYDADYFNGFLPRSMDIIPFFLVVATITLALALITGFIFTNRNAHKKGLKIWDSSAKRLAINLFIPLVSGGIFCLILLYHGVYDLIAPATLVFYGLALLNASKYTLTDIRYLSFCQIILGLLNTYFIGYGLLIWTIGFGVIHILYGIIMWWKYERSN